MNQEINYIIGKNYRITILTECLLRLEYSENGIFEDRKTQTVVNRDFPDVKYKLIENDNEIEILTDKIHLIYDKKQFSSSGLSVEVLNGIGNVWHYGYWGRNLKGTIRTLDDIDGKTELGMGVLSQSGYAILDDSKSMIQTDDDWVEPAQKDKIDIYFFGYGFEYKKAIKDFYHLCGKTPMLPRFALGNWWSRYCQYTEESYKKLMTEFEKREIPFSVAVIDMDWHLVDIDPKYGDGWTGYTWNKEFFPNPKGFMSWLHEHNKRVTLNVHPASGVRAFEEMYVDMAKELGVDWQNEVPITFDITNKKFMNAYFKYLHHPNEDKGVDFWWIDWQQGKGSKIEGLDGLWLLNHCHFLDSGRDNKRPMTFSRYAGPGSHRYPVGFSGDTIITWESLDFQPYFTSTASNIGFGWWSNDIGGHMFGYHNEELSLRWYQFGVFSPIMRLHSSNNPFLVKEPWNYSMEIEKNMVDILRLRHKLIPYLYTMNYLAYENDMPIMQPMYYDYPKNEEAFEVANQYKFGTELLVMPITSPMLNKYKKSKVTMWLPEGKFIDIFTNRLYNGGRKLNLYRALNQVPVFAKAGAIIPMICDNEIMNIEENPRAFEINIYGGSNGEFTIYEDDNTTQNYLKNQSCKTKLIFNWDNNNFTIIPTIGELSLIPQKRSYKFNFCCVENNDVKIFVNENEIKTIKEYNPSNDSITIILPEINVTDKIEVVFSNKLSLAKPHIKEDIFNILNIAEIEHSLKEKIYAMVCENESALFIIPQLQTMNIDVDLINIITEILTAR